ncbi:MAG: hypothetical protein EOO90_25465 [Pedobacter sp.]|nr:MAG: hypothetical protein EOO90_25465 [Pedobacter sp.]
MRTFITMSLCFMASLCFAQDQTIQYKKVKGPFSTVRDTVIFANACILLVENNFTKFENYRLTKEAMVRVGIEFIEDKRGPNQIITNLIPISEGKPDSGKYIIRVLCKDNKLRMTCQYKSKRKHYDRNYGIIMFAKMKEVADQMGGQIYYTN